MCPCMCSRLSKSVRDYVWQRLLQNRLCVCVCARSCTSAWVEIWQAGHIPGKCRTSGTSHPNSWLLLFQPGFPMIIIWKEGHEDSFHRALVPKSLSLWNVPDQQFQIVLPSCFFHCQLAYAEMFLVIAFCVWLSLDCLSVLISRPAQCCPASPLCIRHGIFVLWVRVCMHHASY